MASLSPITDIVKALLPKCPAVVINRHLLKAAQELCRASLAWTAVIPSADMVADDFPATIEASETTRVVKILSVRCNGLQLEQSDIVTEEGLSDSWRESTGVPKRFVEETSGQLLVVPLPSESSAVQVEVAIEPANDSLDIADHLLVDHEDTLVAGTVARLCVIPGQPWSSPDLAGYYKGEFGKGIDEAKVVTNKNRRVGSCTTMSTRPFSL